MNMLQPAGPVAAALAEMAWVLIAGAAALFLGMMGLLVVALRRPPGERGSDRPGAGGRRWLMWGGLVLPALVLLPLLVYTASTSVSLLPGSWQRSAPAGAAPRLVVSVTGRMWWWEVNYHEATSGRVVATANEIRLPVGEPVALGLNSGDVIHSFWVPPLAGKVDMVPGRVHQLVLQADEAGVYRGQCAEFCGEQHARMALHLVALPRGDFEQWLAAQAAGAKPGEGDLQSQGLAVFMAQRCNACHTVRGVPGGEEARAGLAPDLTHVGSRLHLAAGTLPMGAQALEAWVAHPQSLKSGVRMPGHPDMEPGALRALAAFLAGLE